MAEGRVVGIVQARTGSARLPNKILRELRGKPMLEQELIRVTKSRSLDTVVVATSGMPADDPVVELAGRVHVGCFRGNEKDVLDRFYRAAMESNAETVVRLTGDCPLHDPGVIDLVVERFLTRQVDYTITPANYPEGLDTEVFSFSALEAAAREAHLPSEREHVTPFIRNHPHRFKLDEVWTDGNFDYHGYHWSVDTEADFQFVEAVYAGLYEEGTLFSMRDVLKLLQNKPELAAINKGGTGYEGLEKTIREDDVAWKKSHSPSL